MFDIIEKLKEIKILFFFGHLIFNFFSKTQRPRNFLKIIYNISLELQKKFERYGIRSDAEMELYQQIPVLEKYINKIEKSLKD